MSSWKMHFFEFMKTFPEHILLKIFWMRMVDETQEITHMRKNETGKKFPNEITGQS